MSCNNNSELVATKLLPALGLKAQGEEWLLEGRIESDVQKKKSIDLSLTDAATPRKPYNQRTKGINTLTSHSSFPQTSCGSFLLAKLRQMPEGKIDD